MLPCAVQPRLDRCRYSTAIRVAEHDEERRVQMTARILQTPSDLRREHISRDANDEQLAEAGAEHQLARHSRVAATQDRRVVILRLARITEFLLSPRFCL